ncbi:outer membrane scaffolding protein for murein synthesis (MipA/OmpV family) [Chitinivorax tropicus]|uniref:Outer membrane scaffolding protein for murein synthesis (MipA/OmpV family) n=1 Tax=Chitinivorax tropicus TaxID=714531 RepID=A0A840MK15_9PROT|nr:MipA/OmpV family protein [Chitinivorax tropicus]MBB5017042.1 outer membrane scaffolding protein for murein synthesis (MipA/OmpV family) [Chitinivorax tropicus]
MKRLILTLSIAVTNASLAAEAPLWEAGLGVAAIDLPDYRGSDERSRYLLPIPYFVYRGDRLKVDRNAIRGVLIDQPTWQIELSGNGTPPVNSKHNHARAGMPDLNPLAELGMVTKLRLSDTNWLGATPSLHLPIRAAYTLQRQPRYIGMTAGLRLNLDWPAQASTAGWNTALQFGPGYSSRAYQDYFYGVAPAHATSERPAYQGRSGYDGVQLTWSASKRVGQVWLGAFVRTDHLQGAAFDDSPLLKQRHTVSAGLGVAWVLGQSRQMVDAAD